MRPDHPLHWRLVRGGSLIAAAWLAGCGARSALSAPLAEERGVGGASGEVATAGAGGGSANASGTSSGAGEGGGAGGSPAACASLAWAGEPVFVRSGSTPAARFPSLRARADGRVAVAFEEVGGGATLVSASIEAWDDWPPQVPPTEPHFPLSLDGSPAATSTGEPGGFAFATSDGAGGLILGQAEPGGSTFLSPGGAFGRAHALARADGALAAPYLLAHGPREALALTWIDAFHPSPPTVGLGAFGCADRPIAVDAIAFGTGFAVASTSDAPLDDCLDPDAPGPPVAAQLRTFDRAGGLLAEDAITSDVPFLDVRVAARTGGGWFATRAADASSALILPFGEDGRLLPSGLHFGLFDEGDFALAASGAGLAIAHSGPLRGSPSGVVVVQLFDDGFGYAAHTVDSPTAPLFPTGRPAILRSPEGGSFLVAFEQETAEGSAIALLRADCSAAAPRTFQRRR